MSFPPRFFFFFFFNDTATTEIYTLSLHDALPIWRAGGRGGVARPHRSPELVDGAMPVRPVRSEEHTSELQSQFHLVCRLLLEKKNHVLHGVKIHFLNLLETPQ